MNISVFLFTAKNFADVFGKVIVLAPNENIAFETLKKIRISNEEIQSTDFDIINILTLCSFNSSTEDWQKELHSKIVTINNNISTKNIIFFMKNIYKLQSNFVYKFYEYYEDNENGRRIYLYDKNNIPYISVIQNNYENSINIPFALFEIMDDYFKIKKKNEILKNKLDVK